MSINNSSINCRVEEQTRWGGKGRSAELLEGVLSLLRYDGWEKGEKLSFQTGKTTAPIYMAQSTKQLLERDSVLLYAFSVSVAACGCFDHGIRACDLCPTPGMTAGSCPRGHSLAQDCCLLTALASHSSLVWAERIVCVIFMFTFLLLRETGHLGICFSHHLQHVPSWGVTGYLCQEPAVCYCSGELLHGPLERFPGPLTT